MTNQQQTLPVSAYPYPSAGFNGTYGQPPPAGYPMSYDQTPTAGAAPVSADTQTRGDGFWKGCCAALCCCCVLDACF